MNIELLLRESLIHENENWRRTNKNNDCLAYTLWAVRTPLNIHYDIGLIVAWESANVNVKADVILTYKYKWIKANKNM